MKRLFLISILSLLILMLVACGGGGGVVHDPQIPVQDAGSSNSPGGSDSTGSQTSDSAQQGDSANNDNAQTPPAFSFKIGDVIIDLDENINDIIRIAGEPIADFEMPSCAFDGMDRVFRYPGADLYTYPMGDDDFVYTIVFFDHTARTAEGNIHLGSSLQAVLDAYGDDYEYETGMFSFIRGLTVLEFMTSDDTVIGISYRLILDI